MSVLYSCYLVPTNNPGIDKFIIISCLISVLHTCMYQRDLPPHRSLCMTSISVNEYWSRTCWISVVGRYEIESNTSGRVAIIAEKCHTLGYLFHLWPICIRMPKHRNRIGSTLNYICYIDRLYSSNSEHRSSSSSSVALAYS